MTRKKRGRGTEGLGKGKDAAMAATGVPAPPGAGEEKRGGRSPASVSRPVTGGSSRGREKSLSYCREKGEISLFYLLREKRN